jgi:glutamate-5-semialdehyde dehydrogenase
MSVADALIRESDAVLAANELDLARMDPEDPRYDRLKLTKERIVDIATDMRKVSSLPNVLDVVLEERVMPNGLRLSRVSVPLGVVGIIYEARPNVTADAWSLCFKTGNVVLLKGGSDAEHSNATIVRIIQSIAGSEQVQLLPSDRAATEALLQARGYVDIVIPRGSQGLIDYVRDHARVPVIETGAGVVHTYLDETADASMAARVIENAKTRRVSVCNALDCLLVHRNRLGELLELLAPLAAKGVEIRADAESHAALAGRYERLERADDFGTEFLSLKLSVKTVGSLEEALAHIRTYGSGHSEAILTGNAEHAEKFVKAVDAAAVYVNTSTAFTDGGQFGLGAEIGISTQKLHARGPMGLEALTSYKWIVRGDGQVRP